MNRIRWPDILDESLFSHMFATLPCLHSCVLTSTCNLKFLVNHPYLPNYPFKAYFWFRCGRYPSQTLSFGIATPLLIPKQKKYVSMKHYEWITMYPSSPSPLCPSDFTKSHYFTFQFLIKSKLIKLNWGIPHNLCSMLQIFQKIALQYLPSSSIGTSFWEKLPQKMQQGRENWIIKFKPLT